jgi:hypothetical protein
MEESIEITLVNLEKIMGARPLDAPMSLENANVGLNLQCKRLEFMDSMNQKLSCDKEMRAR